MRLRSGFAAALVLAAFSPLPAFAGPEPYGTWLRPEDGTTFTFSRCGGATSLCVRVKGVRDPADARQIGTVVFSNAALVAENVWRGEVYNPDDGQRYMGKITLTGAASLTLEGCVMGGAICKGETWTRLR